MTLSTEVLNVLGNAVVTGDQVVLTGKLDRQLYVAVNNALVAMGGKWNRKAQAHVFDADPEPLIDETIVTGQVTSKKTELGCFFTPKPVADQVMELAGIEQGMLTLEPSAGVGALAVEAAKRGAIVHTFEIDPKNNEKLANALFAAANYYHVNAATDFMTVTPITANSQGDLYDRVIMNPPFKGQSDITHVLHAFTFLKPGGRLVSVMAAGVAFRTNRKSVEFRQFVAKHNGTIEALSEGSFKESGTGINTVIVTLEA